MKLFKAIAVVAIIVPSISIPNPVIAGSSPVGATYKQVRECHAVSASNARIDRYGWISAAGQTIYLSKKFAATGPTQSCGYVTDFSEREITNPSGFN